MSLRSISRSAGNLNGIRRSISPPPRRIPRGRDRDRDRDRDNDDYIDSQVRHRKRSRKSNFDKTLTLDRISMLPDSVLIHTLSFLPIEEIIRTGVLSKRWQYLWTFSPNLLFIDRKKNSPSSNFVSFVDQTLLLCGASKIKRFMVDFCDLGCYSNVNSWVRFAMKNNAEELGLHLGNQKGSYCEYDCYKLPQHLYTKSRLAKLSLSYCDFVPKGVISWNSLKSLSIGLVNLRNDMIEKILLGSPVLEYLELHDFGGIDSLNITSATLKKLVIRDYHCKGNKVNNVLEIAGPNLHSLDILGCFHGTRCRIMNVESLVEANLSFNLRALDGHNANHEEYGSTLKELLESLNHVENFTIGTWCIQVLIIFEKVGLQLPLSTRKCLQLDTGIENRDIYGIVNLLASSTDLQTLIINMDPPYKSEISYDTSLFDIPKLTRTKCLCLHLKTIRIVNFVEGNCVFELLELLLKSEVLEKMIISAPREGNDSSWDLFGATKKLLSLPRASPRAVISFSE